MLGFIILLTLLNTVSQQTLDLNYSELSLSIAALNQGLGSQTNIIYTDDSHLFNVNAEISQTLKHIPSLLVSQNLSKLFYTYNNLPEPILMILPQLDHEQILQVFEKWPDKMQKSDYLFVGNDNADNWFYLHSNLWKLGYPNILIYNITQTKGVMRGTFFTSDSFPQQRLLSSSVDHYLWARRHWFDNLGGWEVRVGLYNNPPRTLVYPELKIYNGYGLMLLREFLAYRGAKFEPILTANYKVYSPNDCIKILKANECDLCGDILALSDDFSFTASFQYLYANVLIPTPQPKSKNFYISAPLQLKTWFLIGLYVVGICSFISFIGWVQHGSFEFEKVLLEIFGSLLSVGFQLRAVLGRLHYILYTVIALGGLICSTYYLSFLKTILSTGLYEPPINTLEDFVKQNISIIIGNYDKQIMELNDYPDILWNVTRVVPYDFLYSHRNVFDTNYAYLVHSDRLVLFTFQQQYMIKPRMRPLPIDVMHSLVGFAMRKEWLLKFKLSETILNCFGSGLLQKLAADTNRKTIHIGFLNLIPSEPYEARPLTLEYFLMPLKILFMGIGLAFVCFLGELLWNYFKGNVHTEAMGNPYI